jgi:hypothetical protein
MGYKVAGRLETLDGGGAMKGWRGIIGTVALVVALGTAAPARADFLEDAGWGGLTVLTNVLYMPAKLVYATVGGITGGVVYAVTVGDLDAAEKVWVMSLGGTYVVTPAMLQGAEPIAFVGTPTANGTTADNKGIQDEPLGSARGGT